MTPMTVNELVIELNKIVKMGGGNRKVLMTSDDEGNSYHYMWFNPEMCSKDSYDITPYCHECISYEDLIKNHIVLG